MFDRKRSLGLIVNSIVNGVGRIIQYYLQNCANLCNDLITNFCRKPMFEVIASS